MPKPVRIALIAVAVVVVLWLLFQFVFPWVEARMENPTIGAQHHLPAVTTFWGV